MKRKIYTPLLLTALFMSTLSQTVPVLPLMQQKSQHLAKQKFRFIPERKQRFHQKNCKENKSYMEINGTKKLQKL